MEEQEKERLHTQGGGIVEWDMLNKRWVFVEDPPLQFKIGDFMPEEWGIASGKHVRCANDCRAPDTTLAREIIDE